ILTPIAIDPGHPFPQVKNKSLNLGVMFTREGTLEHGFGVVQVPSVLPRLLTVAGIKTPSGNSATRAFVLLEDLVARHASTIFPGVRIKGLYVFRVTRNFDIEVDEEEADDLLQSIQQELRRRERGNAVRLEVAGDPPPGSLAKLVKALKLDPDKDVYPAGGMLNVADLMGIATRDSRDDLRALRDEPFMPHAVPPLREKGNKLRRYAHLSTGNYNPTTARLYTDLSLLTARADICEDVSSLFNLLTGYSAPPRWNKLTVAPLGLHEVVLGLIAREVEHARAGRPARIVAKMK